MKVINHLGNEYKGAIGGVIVAGSWKGRNYLRKNTEPKDPKSDSQEKNRNYFRYGVNVWKGFPEYRKKAYGFFVRYHKLRIDRFNGMVGEVVKALNAGPNYFGPPGQRPEVQDFDEHFPLQGAEFTVKRKGGSVIYARGYTDFGGVIQFVVCFEDNNYDLKIIRDEYQDYYAKNIDADGVSDIHYMKLID